MAIDIYDSAVLTRTLQMLPRPESNWLLNRYFGEVQTSEDERVYFDVMEGKPRLSPFVSPFVEGQIVHNWGYKTASFSPAYIKDKRVAEDAKPPRRAAGQRIAAPLSYAEARRVWVVNSMQDQLAMLTRRLEWMAAQVLRTGMVTVTGEKYPTAIVDFGRDANLTVQLTGSARWTETGSDPLDDLETWVGTMRTVSGATATEVVMSNNVWSVFRKHPAVVNLLEKRANLSALTVMETGPRPLNIGAQYMGRVGNFDIWVYFDVYVDEAGTTQSFLPDDWLLMPSANLEGVQHFGAIRDESVGFVATEYYPKSWVEPDPSVRYLMLQSAPLVVPYRVNASFAAKVLGVA